MPRPHLNVLLSGALTLAICAACSLWSATGSQAASPTWTARTTWITQAEFLNHYRRLHARWARALFDNRHTYVVIDRQHPMPRRWRAIPTVLFKSYAAFAKTVNGRGIAKGVKAVIYDNEPQWGWAPAIEKAGVERYTRRFAQLAHRRGYRFIAAPGGKIFDADGPGIYFTAAARYADVLDVQIQHSQGDAGVYQTMLQSAVALAKRLNPHVKIVAETTSNAAYVPSAVAIADLMAESRRSVAGLWPYAYDGDRRSVQASYQICTALARRHG